MHAGNSNLAEATRSRSAELGRRITLAAWVAIFAAVDFDRRLLPWTAAVIAAIAGIEFALVRWRRSRAAFVAAHFALAAILSAHATVTLSSFDLGLTIGATAIAFASCAALVVHRASRRTLVSCCVFAGTCAMLAVAELALPPSIAWSMPGRADPYERWSADLFEPDPELGWVMRANATVEDRAYLDLDHLEWSAVYHTGANGQRVVPLRPERGPALLLFGCSYTFGHGLADEQTIAAQIQKARPEWRVFNCGALAYGTAQSWLAMRRCSEPAASEVAYVFIDDHLRRDSADRGWLRQFPREPIFQLDASGQLQRIPVGVLGYIARRVGWSLWKRSIVFRRLDALVPSGRDDERDVARAAALVDAMRADVRAKWGPACRFVIVFVPEAEEREMSTRARDLMRVLGQREFECIDGFRESNWTGRSPAGEFDRATGHPRPELAAEIASWITGALDHAH